MTVFVCDLLVGDLGMSLVSVEQRQRIRAEQKQKQGHSWGPTLIGDSPVDDCSPTPAVNPNKARISPPTQLPPTKKAKNAPVTNLEIGLTGEGGPSSDASGRNHLKSQKRGPMQMLIRPFGLLGILGIRSTGF